MQSTDSKMNCLFGLLALKNDLIDSQQLFQSYLAWSAQQEFTLPDLLVERGALSEQERALLETQLDTCMTDPRRDTESTDDKIREKNLTQEGIENQTLLEQTDLGAAEGIPATARHDATIVHLREKVTRKGLHSTGGMGEVWVAYDEILQREIALKELKGSMSDSARNRERFFREAQLTGQLEHPGIVPVYQYSADEQTGRSCYTMRFVKGRTFTEAIQAYHKLRTASGKVGVTAELIRLLNTFVDICQTIAYAHSRHVIHRDIKGDNVILGDFGEVIVLDWGLAKRLDDPEPEFDADAEFDPTIAVSEENLSATMQGEKLGTPAYMAPEQAAGKIDQIDYRTDVYCLAAILYEILTGEPPFLGASIVEILNRVIHEAPRPPADRLPGMPSQLDRICLQGLSKNRDQRQQSALDLAEQVQSWISERAERKRTEQERERFFNLSLDLLVILDAGGGLTQTNPAWATVLGWSSSDLGSMTVWDILHPEEQQQLTKSLERILAGESLTAVEHRCLCKDGSYRWVLWNASLIAGESSIYLVGRDITERKQTEQTFHELLESAPDGMVVINAAGQIVLVNSQLERLFGFRREELLGRSIEILVPKQFRGEHPQHVARFFANPDFRPMASGLKLQGQRKCGETFPAEISLSPVKTEQGLLVSAAVRDLSRRSDETHK